MSLPAYPLMSSNVQNRMAACAIELGCALSWATAPRMKIEREGIPAAYGLLGVTSIPSVQSRGVMKVSRVFTQRFLLFPYTGGADIESGGAEGNLIALEWIDKIHFYYHSHDTLATETLAPLRNCVVTNVADTGLIARKAPGGNMFAAIDASITVLMAANLPRFSPPYPS